MRLLRIPVVKSNGPQGTFLVDCGPGTYPAGTQTHAFIVPQTVVGIEPLPTDSIWAEKFAGGCSVLLVAGHSILTAMSAEDLAEMLKGELM